MNHQEIFDTAVTGILNQGCYSLGKNGACMLRGKDGSKCAVGFLIADEDYHANMEEWAQISDYEGNSYESPDPYCFLETNIGVAVSKTVGEIDEGVMNLLGALQEVHDTGSLQHDFDDLAELFRAEAVNFGLSAKVIDDWQNSKKEAS